MSIIYDALKKSQQARAAKAPVAVARKRKLPRKNTVITLLILTCLFMIVAAFTLPGGPSLKLPTLGKAKTQPKVPSTATAPRLMLEGVFLSDTEKLAMINHRSYHEGDNVSGMQVVSIAFDEVQLRSKTRSVTLRSALTQLN